MFFLIWLWYSFTFIHNANFALQSSDKKRFITFHSIKKGNPFFSFLKDFFWKENQILFLKISKDIFKLCSVECQIVVDFKVTICIFAFFFKKKICLSKFIFFFLKSFMISALNSLSSNSLLLSQNYVPMCHLQCNLQGERASSQGP